ncbi:MAG: sulfite exporter TauE/SafE family protein [Acidothermus sp.]|nr:sulfite exporter TauE/SafE family protein [Acidothermus sp.]MCL6538339.1 sulfite exporter TauE/SafE family protein [Acidothermus sp.]
MTFLDVAGVFGAGIVAGTVNTIVGSGSLLTFPVLLGVGLSPLAANVTNTVGLVPGSVSGAIGYRQELGGQRRRVWRLVVSSLLGALVGAVLLLALPSHSFERVVPFLVLLASLLVLVQPQLARAVSRRNALRGHHPERLDPLMDVGNFLTAVYGGYFGAAQGVILIALLGVFIDDHLQRLNAVKNVLAAVVNGVAAVIFAVVAPVHWWFALAEALGAVIGGQLGATVGRRIPPRLLRGIIVVVGVVVAAKLLSG